MPNGYKEIPDEENQSSTEQKELSSYFNQFKSRLFLIAASAGLGGWALYALLYDQWKDYYDAHFYSNYWEGISYDPTSQNPWSCSDSPLTTNFSYDPNNPPTYLAAWSWLIGITTSSIAGLWPNPKRFNNQKTVAWMTFGLLSGIALCFVACNRVVSSMNTTADSATFDASMLMSWASFDYYCHNGTSYPGEDLPSSVVDWDGNDPDNTFNTITAILTNTATTLGTYGLTRFGTFAVSSLADTVTSGAKSLWNYCCGNNS